MNVGPVGSHLLPLSLTPARDGPAVTAAVPSGRPAADAARAPGSTAAKAAVDGRDLGLGAPDNLMASALWSCRAQVILNGRVTAEHTAVSEFKHVAADVARQEALRLAGGEGRCVTDQPVRLAD